MSPSDLGDVIGEFAWAAPAQAEEAIAAARRALTGWRRGNIAQRSELLRRAGDAIAARLPELSTLISREEGKTLADARAEVLRAAHIFHFFSGECVRSPGRFMPGLRDGVHILVEHEPVGVVAVITPWNLPIAVPAWKIAAALAYGNTVVFKPSEVTPACGVALAEILVEAGIPSGVFNLLNGAGNELGAPLIDGADAVTFTGSTPVGREVLRRAVGSMTKVQLELGGKSPLVVLDDADLGLAVAAALDGAFGQTGQRCTASSRLVIAEGIHDRFVDLLAAQVHALRVGHAFDAATEVGPVATERQLAKNVEFAKIAVAEGAELLCGGDRATAQAEGYYFAPALLVGTTNDMRLNREEVFGPVIGVIRVADLDEALGVAADSEFALSAAICTKSSAAAELFRRESRAGMVVVNGPTTGADYHVPFGGRAPSGYGPREQGSTAAEFFTEIKTSYVTHGIVSHAAADAVS